MFYWWMFYWWTWQGTSPKVWSPTATPDPNAKATDDLALTRHTGRSNFLYGDGHVKSSALSELWKAGQDNPFWSTPPSQ